MKKEVQELSTI